MCFVFPNAFAPGKPSSSCCLHRFLFFRDSLYLSSCNTKIFWVTEHFLFVMLLSWNKLPSLLTTTGNTKTPQNQSEFICRRQNGTHPSHNETNQHQKAQICICISAVKRSSNCMFPVPPFCERDPGSTQPLQQIASLKGFKLLFSAWNTSIRVSYLRNTDNRTQLPPAQSEKKKKY